jgi:hypothetical protein
VIVFDLRCGDGGERFEAWFHSNTDYEAQAKRGLVECPYCGSTNIDKAPMAPSVPRKGSDDALKKLAAAQADMLRNSQWVGDKFAETARAMHSGEIEPAAVHGQARLDEVKALAEEGVPVAPLPLPIVPPGQVN